MIAADQYIKERTDDLFDLDVEEMHFQKTKAFSGCELVHETHRLALMNAMLHDIEGEITLGDTLTNIGKNMKDFDLVLTNPPFGTEKRRRTCNKRRLYLPYKQQTAKLPTAHL